MTIVNVHEAKSQLSALIQKVLAGEEVIIARNNIPVATLIKFVDKPERVGWGALKGKIIETPDCWDTDDEIQDMFYDSDNK